MQISILVLQIHMLLIPTRYVSNKILSSVHNRLKKWLRQQYYSQLLCDCFIEYSIDLSDEHQFVNPSKSPPPR